MSAVPVRIVGYLQDMAQLRALYKERWESFLANAGVIQSFAPNDLTTAEWLSQRSGQKTIGTKNASRGRETTTSWQQIGRAELLPHELIGFKRGSACIRSALVSVK
jgi:type IV secretion system protein VirD4